MMWYEDDENYWDEEKDVFYLGGEVVTKDVFLAAHIFLVNGATVSKEQYLQALNSVIADNPIYVVNSGIPITNSNIEEMIANFSSFVVKGDKTAIPH